MSVVVSTNKYPSFKSALFGSSGFESSANGSSTCKPIKFTYTITSSKPRTTYPIEEIGSEMSIANLDTSKSASKPDTFSYRDILKKGLNSQSDKQHTNTTINKNSNSSSVEDKSQSNGKKSYISAWNKIPISINKSHDTHDTQDTQDTQDTKNTKDEHFGTDNSCGSLSSGYSSQTEVDLSNLISSESNSVIDSGLSSPYNSNCSYSSPSSDSLDSSEPDSPLMIHNNCELKNSNLKPSSKTSPKSSLILESRKSSPVNENDFLNPDWKLPGGKKYQKDGARLETAFYNGLPKWIKKYLSVNVKPRYKNGNVIVEFDMIYQSDSSKRIISFEIKGVNPNTINNLERQKKLLSQGIRQKKYLEENYSGYKIDCVYCFVTGKIKTSEIVEEFEISEEETPSEWKFVKIPRTKSSSQTKSILDGDFINRIKLNGIGVAIGETPQQCAKNALFSLNLLR
jgi:hypothetical protein